MSSAALTIDSRELRMQLHRPAVAALVILDQAHQRPHRGILDWCAELFGRIARGAVVTGGIRPANNSSGLGPRFSMPFSNGFPNVTSSNRSGVRMVPERPPLEIASAVNKVFITAKSSAEWLSG
jgi:hypothetical protein